MMSINNDIIRKAEEICLKEGKRLGRVRIKKMFGVTDRQARKIAKHLSGLFDDKPTELTDDEKLMLEKYRGIKDNAENCGLDPKTVKQGWLHNWDDEGKKQATMWFTNPNYIVPEFNVDDIDWDNIVPDVELDLNKHKTNPSYRSFDRLVYTDVHIGMNPQANYSQYDEVWDKDRILKCLDIMIAKTILNKKSDLLIIDDLGDFLDGWDGFTVRRKHKLPQNMNNQEAFDLGLHFKIKLVMELLKYYKKVICNSVTKDNHAGDFGYIVNSALKVFADKNIVNADINIFRKFMNHYTVGYRTFILCHGKDDINLNKSIPAKLTKTALEKIDNYIDYHYIAKKNMQIEFSKGNDHVEVFDKELPSRFSFRVFPAFCPASGWVQANYVPKDYGFYIFNYHSDGSEQIYPYYFNKIK